MASIEQILTLASLRAQVGGEPPMYAKRGCATDVRVCVRVCVYVYVYMYACVKGTVGFDNTPGRGQKHQIQPGRRQERQIQPAVPPEAPDPARKASRA